MNLRVESFGKNDAVHVFERQLAGNENQTIRSRCLRVMSAGRRRIGCDDIFDQDAHRLSRRARLPENFRDCSKTISKLR